MDGTAHAITTVGAANFAERVLDMPEPFEDFYRRELHGLIAFARVLSGSAHAEDIAQESMLAAYRKWDVVRTLDAPAAWVRRVCANRSVSAVRRRAAEARALVRFGARPEAVAVVPTSADSERFWSSVRRLPRRQAQVIALHYIYDLSVADIATTLGCAEGTVKVHLSRARQALALHLDRTAEELS